LNQMSRIPLIQDATFERINIFEASDMVRADRIAKTHKRPLVRRAIRKEETS